MIALLRGLRRAFSPGKNDPLRADAADLLRVGCTIAVAAYHIWQQSWLNPAFSLFGLRVNLRNQVATGYLGVDLLLMLSGFLLYLPYAAGHTPDVRGFYLKRAARILPSYWFCLLIMLAFAAVGGLYASAGAMFRDLLAHATFTHNLSAESYVGTPLNGALWTLAVEVQFYLIFPLLARVFRRWPVPTYAAMLLISRVFLSLWVLPREDTTLWFNQLPALMEVYANGMLAAHIYGALSKRRCESRVEALLCTLLAVAACAALWMLADTQGRLSGYEVVRRGQLARRFPLSAAGAVFVVCGSRSLSFFRSLCSNRLTRFLSGVSFNFYVWHQVLALKLKQWRVPPYVSDMPQKAAEQPWQHQYTLLCWLAALAMAILVTYAVERPCARRMLRGRKRKPAN